VENFGKDVSIGPNPPPRPPPTPKTKTTLYMNTASLVLSYLFIRSCEN